MDKVTLNILGKPVMFVPGSARIEGCRKYKIGGRFPPGPCRKKTPKGAEEVSSGPAPAKKATPPATTIPKVKAVPKAPGAPKKTAPAKATTPAAPKKAAAPETVTREQASELQKQMLAGNPWTAGQKNALSEYSAFFYNEMNGHLRGFNVADELYPEDVIEKHIKNAVAGLRPLPKPVTVFRNSGTRALLGRSIDNVDERLAALNALVGKSRQERGFTSTSIRDDLTDFGNIVQLEIEVPEGTPAAFIRGLSDAPDEDELLLPPGMRFEFPEPPRRDSTGRITVKVKVSAP